MALVSPYVLAYGSKFNVKCCGLILLLSKVRYTYAALQEIYGYQM